MAVDPIAESLGEQIKVARDVLVEKSREAPGEWWSARELKAQAESGWNRSVVNLALSRLIEDGTFALEKGKVRLTK